VEILPHMGRIRSAHHPPRVLLLPRNNGSVDGRDRWDIRGFTGGLVYCIFREKTKGSEVRRGGTSCERAVGGMHKPEVELVKGVQGDRSDV
jgi:hypothetical protein